MGNGSQFVGVVCVLDMYNAPECKLDVTGACGKHPASENPKMKCLGVF